MAIVPIRAYDEFVELITSLPSLEQIAEFRLSEEAEARISTLMEASNHGQLAADEAVELDEYLQLEHIMRKAKLRASEKATHST
ncbi:MAG: hypothetical protein K8J31_12750 [Anaerolineae bacterium]|nr:hypothetical protein [Anaerolineae bacterium]